MLVLVGCGGLGVDVVERLAIVRRYLVNSPPVGSLHATVMLVVVDDTWFGATGRGGAEIKMHESCAETGLEDFRTVEKYNVFSKIMAVVIGKLELNLRK